MNSITSKLAGLRIPGAQILRDEPLARHTSFRIGGPADYLITAATETELAGLLRLLTQEEIPHLLIGNGSNLLFADEGYRGVIVRLGGEFTSVAAEPDGTVRAGGAALLSKVSAVSADAGLTGMEFASGIPGSVGGAVFMNAGAYGGEIRDVLRRVRFLSPDGTEAGTCGAEDLRLSYRHSALQEDGRIILGAELQLTPGDPSAIRARIQELTEKRNAKQPVNWPSAGSTFKRPVGGYAAALIEQAGL